jgi:hypothetical protein
VEIRQISFVGGGRDQAHAAALPAASRIDRGYALANLAQKGIMFCKFYCILFANNDFVLHCYSMIFLNNPFKEK